MTPPTDMSLVSKTCISCDQSLPLAQFYKAPRTADGHDCRCKRCRIRMARQRWYAIKYGITLEEFEAMEAAQDGLCALCASPGTPNGRSGTKRLSVDHCHETGRVRALLCNPCNVSLGLMKESPELLRKAADYLELFRGDE